METFKIWERFGVEMEYMIVDRDTLQVLPRADVPLGKDKDGNQLSDTEYGDIGLSNELVSHVLEFKCAHPRSTFDGLGKHFQHEIRRANKKLEKINAMLLPSAAHPFMDPAEKALWPYECKEIYDTYDRIFDCRGHGWANLQSTHLNLSFDGDDEFGELHAAIRIMLPLIPAIAASSPYLDGKFSGFLDARIETYRHNQDKIPSIAGKVIPEPVYTYDDYNRVIFDRIKKDIAPYDTEHLLNHFFLNSRGAIARFDRGAIEIRLVDIQECPNADIAIAELEIATLKAIACGRFCNAYGIKDYRKKLRNFDTDKLSNMLTAISKGAEDTVVDDVELLTLFDMDPAGDAGKKSGVTAGDIWKHIFEVVQGDLTEVSHATMQKMLRRGTLASALHKTLGDTPTHEAFVNEYKKLADCLAHNRLYATPEDA